MTRPPRPEQPFLAVISDMDGVITRTASVHLRAWREMFDGFLRARTERAGEDRAPFTDADYREHLDGKPRLTGVRDFLASRGIDLPEGDPEDAPDRDTVHGLGARKNVVITDVLDRGGVEVFADTIAAFDRWQRGGLPVAVISASRNCRRVLAAAKQLDRFPAVVDGETAARENLDGKAEQIARAAELLDVDPARCVLLEDATSGVRAGRKAGCGLVVGVDRVGGEHPADLRRAGAHVVVEDVAALRFVRRIPAVAQQRRQFDALRAGRPLCVFLDFDGTLSPIVDDPDAATIDEPTRAIVRRLADRYTVAVVSGRDRRDVQQRVALDGIFYAGSHGLDIAGPDRRHAHPDAEAAIAAVDQAEQFLHERVGKLTGAVIERKRYSVAAHYRMVAVQEADRVKDAARDALAATTGLQARPGKMVVELVPQIDWDKGKAVTWLLGALAIDPQATLVLYLGDDETDEDAFAALQGRGVGIHVGPEVSDSLADLRLDDPRAVADFLAELAADA
jgi:trehalose-phosphatase